MEKRIRRAAFGVLCLLSFQLFAATVSFEDLARHAQYSQVKISADGHYLAATTVVKGKPMLMFFPGRYEQSETLGSSLVLFGRLKDDQYYRAKNILEQEA